MTDPYQVLDVPETADDAAVKKAYLRKVREFPPERSPERFQAVRRAFETIATRRDRLRHRLFEAEPPEPAELLAPEGEQDRPHRPPLALLKRVLARTLGKP